MDVYLLFFLVPVHVSFEHAHSSVFKQEFVDVEFCVGTEFPERSHHVSPSRRLAAEAHGVEVHEVEHVVHVHRLEVYRQGVVGVVGGGAVDEYVLLSVFNLELFHVDEVFPVVYLRSSHVPLFVTYINM